MKPQLPESTRKLQATNSISRRTALKIGATGLAGLATFGVSSDTAAGDAKRDRYAGLHSRKYLGKVKTETHIEDKEVFTEGPTVDRDGIVFFTNVPVDKILRWDPKEKKLSVFRRQSNKTNGMYFEPDGSLLACEGETGAVTRIDMKTGKITVLAKEYNGFKLASPNDICRDARGRLYFTSRPGGEDPTTGNVNSVYRIDPNGKLTQILAWPNIQMPNGIVTSPDDKVLYVIEAHPDADRNRNILAFDLGSDGSISNRRTHINFYPGRSGDGMCIDAEGNLYVAAGLHKLRGTSETLDTRPGIHVVSPAGKLVAYVETPVDTITNCAFGGAELRTLYVTCGTHLLSIPTKIPGKASYRPQA